MDAVYVDTSALARVLLDESDREVIKQTLARATLRISSRLLAVELRRVGLREQRVQQAEELLREIALIALDEPVLSMTERLPPTSVGTLDAIHLATAARLHEAGDLDAILTYDKRLADGAREHGIEVLSPT